MPDPESKKRWDKDNTRKYGFKLFKNKDADVIAALDSADNVTDYIRQAIREKAGRDKK